MAWTTKRFGFKRIGVRLGVGFGVVIVIMLAMVAIAGMQLWRIEALNAEAARDNQRVRLVQTWSALVRTNLDRALTATRLHAAAGDDEAIRTRVVSVLGRLNEDMASAAAATLAVQEQVNALFERNDSGREGGRSQSAARTLRCRASSGARRHSDGGGWPAH